MGFQKVLVSSEFANVAVSEEAGVAKISATVSAHVGGGALEGVAKVSSVNSVELSAHQLIDAGLELFKAKFPSSALLVDGAKAILDAEMAKI